MKRGAPLKRTPLKRGGSTLKRTGRLNPRSQKTIDNAPLRAEVRAEVLGRKEGCYGKVRVPEVQCRGETYVHELWQRSISPGSHLRAEMAKEICPAHDNWLCNNIAEAHERGLLMHSWDAPPAA